MAAGDWIKLYRKSLDSVVFADDWLWKLWTWCLMKANWKTVRLDRRDLVPGSFVTSQHLAALDLRTSPSRVSRGLHALERKGMITLEATSLHTVVTICKWGTYQTQDSESDEQVTSARRARDERPIQGKDEEGKEGEDILRRRRRPRKATGSKPREPNPVFDAIAEITGFDPKASGSWIGRAAAALAAAEPPYTPDEVRRLPDVIRAKWPHIDITPGVVEKYIGWVRQPPKADPRPSPASRTKDLFDAAFRSMEDADGQP